MNSTSTSLSYASQPLLKILIKYFYDFHGWAFFHSYFNESNIRRNYPICRSKFSYCFSSDECKSEPKFSDLCRLCAKYDSVKISVFSDEGKRRELQRKIQSCLPFKVISIYSYFGLHSCYSLF